MVKDLPSITGNERPASSSSGGVRIVDRKITPAEIKNMRVNANLEKFSIENIEDPDADDIEFAQAGVGNLEAGIIRQARKVGRGDAVALDKVLDRLEGPVAQHNLNVNANISLDDYLEKLDASDATPKELAEAGIVIDAEVTDNEDSQSQIDEEDYVADM
jgi:hypothetical protein